MSKYVERYIFGKQGKNIKQTFYKEEQSCYDLLIEVDQSKIWFNTEDYIKQLKKLIEDYEKYYGKK